MKRNYETPVVFVTMFADTVKLDEQGSHVLELPDDELTDD